MVSRNLIRVGVLAFAVCAPAAQACDMHGDFGYDMAAYYRGGAAPGAAAWEAEAARQQAQDLALAEARTAFLNRFAIKVEQSATVLASNQPPEKSSSDADRRSQPASSDR